MKDVFIAFVMGFVAVILFMGMCLGIAGLVSLYLLALQRYPMYVFPCWVFAWVCTSWYFHEKLIK